MKGDGTNSRIYLPRPYLILDKASVIDLCVLLQILNLLSIFLKFQPSEINKQ